MSSHEARSQKANVEKTDDEVLSPATPGAQNLGSPDATPDTAGAEVTTDESVLAPATPGADILGSPDADPDGSDATADDDVLIPATPGAEAIGVDEAAKGSEPEGGNR